MQRWRIAPLLTGEDLAELLALADMCVVCGGSLHFTAASPLIARLVALRLIKRGRPPKTNEDGRQFSHSDNARLHQLTTLGWLTLLTRVEHEMRHLLPAPQKDEEAE